MAMSQPNLVENPIKLGKFRNINRPTQLKRNKLVSFWAFLFSLIMYISIFYMFNLSPYTLVSTTNFWFFISNTLILIITVDFNFGSSFSSSSNDQEYSFQEYYMKVCQEKSTSSYNYPPYTIEKKETIIPHEEEESIKDVLLVENNKQQEEDEDEDEDEEESIKDVLLVENNKQLQEDEDEDEDEEEIINIIDHKNEMKNKKSGESKFYRSNSELKAIIPMEKNMKKIQRSQSERYDLQVSEDHEEINDEFSDMSVEELNRRVEDFIQRFNRQIRLQAAARNNYLQT